MSTPLVIVPSGTSTSGKASLAKVIRRRLAVPAILTDFPVKPLIALYAAWPAGVALIRGVTFTCASDKTYWVDEARLPRGELLAAALVGAIGLAAAVVLILPASP